MSTSEKRTGRREFLTKTAATAAIGAGCWRASLREALAQALASGKPLLTETNINALVDHIYQRNQTDSEFLAAKRAMKTWLPSNFKLSLEQLDGLNAMKDSEVAKVQQAIDQALAKHYRLQVKITPRPRPTSRPIERPGGPVTSTAMMAAEEEPGWKVGGVTIQANGSYSPGTKDFEGTVTVSFSC